MLAFQEQVDKKHMRECCKSANNLNKLKSIITDNIPNQKEKIKKEKIQKVFSLSLRTLISPDYKNKKDPILYEYRKREEEIKNIITPKQTERKSLSEKCPKHKRRVILSEEKSKFNYKYNFNGGSKTKLFDDYYYKNELRKNTNYFNEPIRRYILLTPKDKKVKILERSKNKICNLELNLDNDYSNNERKPVKTQKNFQLFLDNYQNLDWKFVDGVKSKHHLSNLKERTYSSNKMLSRNVNKDIMKKQGSLFKNEEIKFLNNL